jgi:hypothetical protein
MSCNSWLSCPQDCDTSVLLPAITNEQDCANYPIYNSQLYALYIFPDGSNLPNPWNTAEGWEGVVQNPVNTPDAPVGKWLAGFGGIPESDTQVVMYPKRQAKVTKQSFTLEFEVRNLSQAQYEFLRALQCGQLGFVFWVQTVADRLFGGPTGIIPTYLNVRFIYGIGLDDVEKAIITIKFCADGNPPVVVLDPEPEFTSPGNAWGNPDNGEVWGDPDTGEVWGWN